MYFANYKCSAIPHVSSIHILYLLVGCHWSIFWHRYNWEEECWQQIEHNGFYGPGLEYGQYIGCDMKGTTDLCEVLVVVYWSCISSYAFVSLFRSNSLVPCLSIAMLWHYRGKCSSFFLPLIIGQLLCSCVSGFNDIPALMMDSWQYWYQLIMVHCIGNSGWL